MKHVCSKGYLFKQRRLDTKAILPSNMESKVKHAIVVPPFLQLPIHTVAIAETQICILYKDSFLKRVLY